MAQFERYDICLAYQALENDFNEGGWLHERPSNQRRKESVGVQLHRMHFTAGMGEGGTFSALSDNAKSIYIQALVKFGLARYVTPDDSDDGLSGWILDMFNFYYVEEHFPHLLEAQHG